MDADKSLGIKRSFKLANCFPQHERLAVDMDAGIIVSGFDPLNVIDGDQRVFRSAGNQEAFRIAGSCVRMLKKSVELSLDGECRVGGDSVSDMSHSGVEPFRADRFDEVIQCMYLKRPDSVGVMGRDKDGPCN